MIELGREAIDGAEALHHLLMLAEGHLVRLLVVGEAENVLFGLLVQLSSLLDYRLKIVFL